MSEALGDTVSEARILTHATRELLEIVIRKGSKEQRGRLRGLRAYTYSLDLHTMIAEESEYEAVIEELQNLVMEIGNGDFSSWSST